MTTKTSNGIVPAALVWIAGLLTLWVLEWPRVLGAGPLVLLVSWNSETTIPLLFLIALPILVLLFPARMPRKRKSVPSAKGSKSAARKTRFLLVCQVLLIYGLSLTSSWWIGRTPIEVAGPTGQKIQIAFCNLPPAYHDEYSYLLQAETFRNGRLSWPKVPVAPDLFHQFHVLNERVTVSRYFPFTGAWMAPFLAFGNPVWGHWIAGALSAVFFFLSARLVIGRAAFLVGLLFAVSPSLAIFSNMLLAHHPTMLALSVFLFCFLKLTNPRSYSDARATQSLATWGPAGREFVLSLLAGFGLAAAMLGRPMTAAGFAAPFGMWLAIRLFRRRHSAVAVVAGFLVPLVSAFLILGICNDAATGDWQRSAYQQYTDQFTPRHRFGFDNAESTKAGAGPEAVQKYDQWATNLTLSTSIQNVKLRVKYSLFWTMNIVLLVTGLVACVLRLLVDRDRGIGVAEGDVEGKQPDQSCFRRTAVIMLLSAVGSLHLVHIPYWYSGILEWHYVFETAPLILLLAGWGLASLSNWLQTVTRKTVVISWMIAWICATVLSAWISTPDVLGTSKVDSWISQMAWSRRKLAEFQFVVNSNQVIKPAIIFVNESDSDPQLSYIINPPDYQTDGLICRLPRDLDELTSIEEQFPDRRMYYWNAETAAVNLKPFQPDQHLPE